MDDQQIAYEFHKLQNQEVKEKEVILMYTKLIHLELRVKNVAISKFISMLSKKDVKKALENVVTTVMKKKELLR